MHCLYPNLEQKRPSTCVKETCSSLYIGMYCLYPNLEHKRAFIASWNEQGEHDPGDMKVYCIYISSSYMN